MYLGSIQKSENSTDWSKRNSNITFSQALNVVEIVGVTLISISNWCRQLFNTLLSQNCNRTPVLRLNYIPKICTLIKIMVDFPSTFPVIIVQLNLKLPFKNE